MCVILFGANPVRKWAVLPVLQCDMLFHQQVGPGKTAVSLHRQVATWINGNVEHLGPNRAYLSWG